ncbi:MAG: RsmE family RNA methyltransferase [Candidatus Aminicenantales bacterium]
MTSNRFFAPTIDPDSPLVFLEGEEHHHLRSVARVTSGEKVYLFDAQGISYLARVEEVGETRTKLHLLKRQESIYPRVKITLAPSILRRKKIEFLLQKAVELGVSRFVPVISTRSIAKMEAGGERKIERWQRIVREAVKQSGNPWLPSVLPPLSLESFVLQEKAEIKLFLHENRGKYLRDILLQENGKRYRKPPSSVLILIGPEGGWTDKEAELILGHGFEEVNLGKNTLRSETAALCSLALISHFWNL